MSIRIVSHPASDECEEKKNTNGSLLDTFFWHFFGSCTHLTYTRKSMTYAYVPVGSGNVKKDANDLR